MSAPLAALAALAALALAPGQEAPAWAEAERGILERHVQLTSETRFRKAGECYFSPDERQIVFQAVERREDPAEEEAFYQMYVGDLAFDGERVVGIEDVVRLSPPGSSNTCGWFHPSEPGVVLFASTLVPPKNPGKTGYQRESSRYSWQFPEEMDIVQVELARADGTAAPLERVISNPRAYLAEASLSRDGRYLVHCEHQVEMGSSGGDLFAVELASGRRVALTSASGYDGGPFFSPDGTRICYRSDRRGDDLLQVFVAELAFDAAGRLTGAAREFQLTDNLHVNWAPYWHPNGRYLVYTTSELGHENYEVFLIDADPGAAGNPTKYGTRRRRVTHADHFDGLPVFDGRGARLMWTCQRASDGSSQVWLADFVLLLDRDAEPAAAAADDASEPAGARPERLQVEDPDTGLFFLYDMATHRLTVYDPRTHQERDAEGAEIQRAMQLFNAPGGDGD